MIRSTLCAITLSCVAFGAQAQSPWQDLVNIDAELARQQTQIDTVLAYHDLANYVGVLFGQVGVAEADAHINALGAFFYQTEVNAQYVADARARVGQSIAAYVNAVWQAAGTSTAWPGGAAQQQRGQQILQAVNAAYPRFLERDLDPTMLLTQVALVAGWARGESQVANPFEGHLARIRNSVPHPRMRAAVAAAAAPLIAPDGSTVARTVPTLPPAATQTVTIPPATQALTVPQINAQPNPGIAVSAAPSSLLNDLLREALEGGLEVGIDRPGLDLTSFDIDRPDPTICLQECQDFGGCKAFTYVKPGVQGTLARCWLKSGQPPAVQSDCCISGTP